MAIAVVVCGNRSEETLVMLKSALLFTKGHLHFYILTDEAASEKLRNRVGIACSTSDTTVIYLLQLIDTQLSFLTLKIHIGILLFRTIVM